MVVIRLARSGTKKRPFYHVVVADSRCPRDGRYIERLGYYNPIPSGKATEICVDTLRVEHWVKQGAQASARVKSILRKNNKDTKPATA